MTYVHVCEQMLKTPIEIYLTYLGNKEIYCIFRTCCVISDLLSTQCSLLHNFIFFCSNNMFLINYVPKFKYQPGRLRVKYT